jgi:hypothetical protein
LIHAFSWILLKRRDILGYESGEKEEIEAAGYLIKPKPPP